MADFLFRARQFLAGVLFGFAATYAVDIISPQILAAGWFPVVPAIPLVIAEGLGSMRLIAIVWGSIIGFVLVWAGFLEISQKAAKRIFSLSLEDVSLIATIVGVFGYGSINTFLAVMGSRRPKQQNGDIPMSKSSSSQSTHQHQRNTASGNATQININNTYIKPPKEGEKQFRAPADPLAGLKDSLKRRATTHSSASETETAGKLPPAGRQGRGGAG